jgi:hypothetical protein
LDATQGSARGTGEGDALKLAARKLTVVEDRSGSKPGARCLFKRVATLMSRRTGRRCAAPTARREPVAETNQRRIRIDRERAAKREVLDEACAPRGV